MKFWDSSAIIPLCIDEEHSETVRAIAREDSELVAWWGSPVECCSSFARLRREGIITSEEEQILRALLARLTEYWSEISASEEVRATARRLLLRHPLRAADSLQLAAALVWVRNQPDDSVFVCLDNRLREAARAEGFTVYPAR
jgi:predicted nucleic acid-binding protein